MDFTREPIVETIITPKTGCKLIIRSSKGLGQEEYFVDAVEVVSFGSTFFFRSQERPKSFLVPSTDYEILEVRETKMIIKNAVIDKSIKIGGGRKKKISSSEEKIEKVEEEEEEETIEEKKIERKRERKHSFRKKKEKGEEVQLGSEEKISEIVPRPIIPPPPNLISQTLEQYKDQEMFRKVFYVEDQGVKEEQLIVPPPPEEKDQIFSDMES